MKLRMPTSKLLVGVIIATVALLLSPAEVSALNREWADFRIPSARVQLSNMEAGCTHDLNQSAAQGGTPRTIVNRSGPYRVMQWISYRGFPAATTFSSDGSANIIPLQFNNFTFLCATLVHNNTNERTHAVTDLGSLVTGGAGSNYPNDRAPVLSGTTHIASLFRQRSRIESAQVISGGGTITNLNGQIIDAWRDPNSRYWFADALNFNYNPGGPVTSARTVTIQFRTRGINVYHGPSGTPGCQLLNGKDGSPGSIDNFHRCTLSGPITATFTITPPPSTHSATCTVSPQSITLNSTGGTRTTTINYTVTNTSTDQDTGTLDLNEGNRASGHTIRLRDRNPTAPWGGTPAAPREIFIPQNAPGATGSMFGWLLLPRNTVRWSNNISIPSGIAPASYNFNWHVFARMNNVDRWFGRCPFTVNVQPDVPPERKPEVVVQGGDTHAGGGLVTLSDGGPCIPTGGSIKTNNDDSGGQYAVSATSAIAKFYSDEYSSDLTFNNDPAPGSYDAVCREDYSKLTASTTIEGDGSISGPGDLHNGITRYTGNLTIGNLGIGNHKSTIIVDGDVTINGNINYPGSYAGRDSIPSLAIVATGDITIDSSVNRIDGLYITNDLFSTCSSTTCPGTLNINGAVVAKKIRLGRTGANGIDNTVGEYFRFLPELYLSPPPSSSSLVDVIKNNHLDLPPVF